MGTALPRRVAPANRWLERDLATLDLPERFDLIVAAGNVIPLLAAGTEAQTVRKLTAHLRQTASWSPDSESMRLICRWPRLHSVSSTTTPGANKLG